MSNARNTFVSFVVGTASAYALYRLLLNDEARSKLKKMGRSLRDAYVRLSEVIQSNAESNESGEAAEANRESVERQWESLGY